MFFFECSASNSLVFWDCCGVLYFIFHVHSHRNRGLAQRKTKRLMFWIQNDMSLDEWLIVFSEFEAFWESKTRFLAQYVQLIRNRISRYLPKFRKVFAGSTANDGKCSFSIFCATFLLPLINNKKILPNICGHLINVCAANKRQGRKQIKRKIYFMVRLRFLNVLPIFQYCVSFYRALTNIHVEVVLFSQSLLILPWLSSFYLLI